ncbi:calmodulin-binding protein 60 D-like [Cocos nucifera]|uniref:Calmodulin-binding protein 60 D-like n=1 Tax=Cocos nucifera TaxID=13894 RepID=A0A8K0NAF6_COCNU|nr:calmodulin-binding protein 60 D-like [Cocos nucifera]
MAPKRPLPPPEEAEDGGSSRALKRWRPLVLEVLGEQHMQRLLVELEKVVRRVDREIRYRLHFWNKLPNDYFTFNSILAEDGMSLRIALMDSKLREVITSDPLSSVKVEVVVIYGDFVGDGHEYWTEKQFKDHVVPQRDGKGPLLTGELVIKLNKGVGYLAHATFTDNSSWTRSQKFRLGVRLSQSECIEERVQEGISEPFRVKDRRVESNQKHHSPLLADEVWRLKNIMKGGIFHQRLVDRGIHTVQQFLQAFTMNHEGLRSLLGDKAKKKEIPNKKWQGILTHAQRCPVGNELYSYSVSGQNVVLIFNSIYELIGAKFDGQYYFMGDLNAFQQMKQLPMLVCGINLMHAQRNEHLNVLSGEEEISVMADRVQSSSFQEPEFSNGLPVGSIPVHPPTANVTAFPGRILQEPQNSDHPATYTDEAATGMGFQQLLQDISSVQDFNLFQRPAFFHGNVSHMNHILGDHSFGTESGRVDECMFRYQGMGFEDDGNAVMGFQQLYADVGMGFQQLVADVGMGQSCTGRVNECMFEGMGERSVLEYSNVNWPTEAVQTSPRKWVKLIAGLKCGLSISKYLAGNCAL